jgi:small-conductance mechanosensitive channel
MNTDPLKTPILTQLYRILSVIILLLAFAGLLMGINDGTSMATLLPALAVLFVAATVALGIAEVFYLIAKIEFNTRENLNDYQVINLLKQIYQNTKNSLKDML